MFAQSLIALVGLLSVQAMKDTPTALWRNSLSAASPTSTVSVAAPQKKNPDTFGVEVTARASVAMDMASGQFLFEKDANSPYPIASLTKLITLMTFLDMHPNLDEDVTISPSDQDAEEKPVFYTGDRFTRRELLRAALVGSVNAAASTLARSTGDMPAFIRAMNDKARSLNMRHATFVDPTGLDPKNQASAKDVALALRAALSYPDIRNATELTQYDVTGRVTNKPYHITTTNLLLGSFLNKDPYRIIVAKTGTLPEAGYCIAQDTRNQDGHEVIAVVLGSENHFARFQDAKALTAWAFNNFEWK